MAEERILTINLRKELLKEPRWKRSKQAVAALRKSLERHVKAEVRIGKDVNEAIWARGGRKPLAKLRLRLVKVSEKVYEARLMG